MYRIKIDKTYQYILCVSKTFFPSTLISFQWLTLGQQEHQNCLNCTNTLLGLQTTVGFWGNINFLGEQGQDQHPIKIYHLGVCLPYFLKFFVEPFLRNRIFKISTLNPGFLTQKHKNPLKSTIFIHFGLAVWQILTIFHQKKDSELILTIFFGKTGKKYI